MTHLRSVLIASLAVVACGPMAPKLPDGFTAIDGVPSAQQQSHSGLVTGSDGEVWFLHASGTTSGPGERRLMHLVGDTWTVDGEAVPASLTYVEPKPVGAGAPGLVWIQPYEPDVPQVAELWTRDGAAYTRAARFQPIPPDSYSTVNLFDATPDGAGTLYVAHGDWRTDLQVSTQRASAATVLGGPVHLNEQPNDATSAAKVRLLADGAPLVAYQHGISTGERFDFARWNGTVWEPFAPSLTPIETTYITGWDLQLDSQGRLVFAYSSNELSQGGTGSVQVLRSTAGGAWETIGSISADGESVAEFPTLRIDPQDRPVVCFAKGDYGASRIHLRRLEANGWQTLGQPLTAGGDAWRPAMTLTADGTPIVAWVESQPGVLLTPSTSRVYTARYSGQ